MYCNDSHKDDLGRVKWVSPVSDFTREFASMEMIFYLYLPYFLKTSLVFLVDSLYLPSLKCGSLALKTKTTACTHLERGGAPITWERWSWLAAASDIPRSRNISSPGRSLDRDKNRTSHWTVVVIQIEKYKRRRIEAISGEQREREIPTHTLRPPRFTLDRKCR